MYYYLGNNLLELILCSEIAKYSFQRPSGRHLRKKDKSTQGERKGLCAYCRTVVESVGWKFST